MNELVFRRVEQKYLLTQEQRERLFKMIDDYIEKDDYFESTICNIYFDDCHNRMIIESIEKPPFKVKLRLRSYGVPKMEDKVFLEIKNKYNGIVGKRRIKMKFSDYCDYLENGCCLDGQIMKEIDYYFKKYSLKPSIFVGYDRKSYRGCENKSLRITIDENLRSRTTELSLDMGDFGEKYFDKPTYIMEIKALDGLPLWLVRSLSELKIYPQSFSKVGNIYKKLKGRSENYAK